MNFAAVALFVHEFLEVNNVCPLIKKSPFSLWMTKHYCVSCI